MLTPMDADLKRKMLFLNIFKHQQNWVVVSNIFYFHPYLGKTPILTNIFQVGWNHQLEKHRNNFNQKNMFIGI